ncbi:MAG: hypothetical protein C4321_11300, partial [Chloroflexota bacterium]
DRDGFVFGEGAVVMVIESEERARARGARVYAELAGGGLSCDAYHITAPLEDGSGACDAMTEALRDAGMTAGDVDYIAAHGTGTPLNDVAETKAIKQAYGEHAFRLATEDGTRADLKGPFFKDWFATVASLRGWRDGDPFMVNYIGHPMMGAVSGYIQVQNDPRGRKQEVGFNKEYFKSRLRAFGFAALYSTQFELGPLS